MLKEFKQFAVQGNVVDMAVGILVGGAFAPIAKSLVDDVIMPPIGLLLGGADFSNLFVLLKEGKTPGPYASLAAAKEAGAVTMNLGLLVNAILTFLIIAFVAFLIVRAVNRLRGPAPALAPPETKGCPECCLDIPLKARRCPHCTAQLAA
jgi:large conductance mechanosensitive channel